MRNPTEIAAYLDEYTQEANVRKYISDTAGAGIAHILPSVYGPIYVKALQAVTARCPVEGGIRLLEYGCGAGMNLLWLVNHLHAMELTLDAAYGADFSPNMIEAAQQEAQTFLGESDRGKVRFCVAANEALVVEMPERLEERLEALLGSFHLVLGVNTFRYCVRLGRQDDAAKGLFDLLRPGGCIRRGIRPVS